MEFTGTIDTDALVEALWDDIGPAVERQVEELVEDQVGNQAESFVEGYLDNNLSGLVEDSVSDYLRYNLGDAVSEALDGDEIDPDNADFESAVLEVVRRHGDRPEVSYETDEFKDAVLKVVTDPEVVVVLTLLIAHGTRVMARYVLNRMDAAAAVKADASTPVDADDKLDKLLAEEDAITFVTGYGLGQDD